MTSRLTHSVVVCILLGCVWSKGATGGRGGGRGKPIENTQVQNTGDLSSVRNIGILENHNWFVYGPVLGCIFLITLCLVYDKIYRCYLSTQDFEEKSEEPTLVIESPPSSVNHSEQKLLLTIEKPSQDDLSVLSVREQQTRLTGSDKMGSTGYSDTDRIVITRKLSERPHESAGQYWINDHQRYHEAIPTNATTLSDTQHQVLSSNSLMEHCLKTFEAARPETLHLEKNSQALLRKQATQTSGRFEKMERQNGRRMDRVRSETDRSETSRNYKSERSDGRSEKGSMGRKNLELVTLLPAQQR